MRHPFHAPGLARALLWAAVLFAPAVLGDGNATVEDWVREALAKNPGLIAARRNADMHLARVGMTRSFMEPMAGLNLMRMDSTDPADIDRNEWMLSQSLPGPGKRAARTRVAGLDAEAARLDMQEKEREVRARVIRAYWELWDAQRGAAAMEEGAAVMARFEQVARGRWPAEGGAPDVLRARIAWQRMTNEVATMRSMIRMREEAVNALLGAPAFTPRDAQALRADLPDLPLDPTNLLEQAKANGGVLQAIKKRIDAGLERERAARVERRPDWEISIMARQPWGEARIQEYDTSIGVTLPWFRSEKYRSMELEASAGRAMAEAEYDEMLAETAVMIRDLCSRIEAERRTLELYEKTLVPQSRQLVDATQAAYVAGRADFMSLSDSLQSEVEARRAAFGARARLGQALAGLEELAGPPIGSAAAGGVSK